MNTTVLLIGILIGILIGYLLFYIFFKSKMIAKENYDFILNKYNENVTALALAEMKLRNSTLSNIDLNEKLHQLQIELSSIQSKNVGLESDYNNAIRNKTDLQDSIEKQLLQLDNLNTENKNLYGEISKLTANNESLADKLSTQKNEMIEIQKTAHLQFEKLANQIFDEKSNKFAESNKANMQSILQPLKEDIGKFKTKVEETYDKESKQRFSLEDKVKELIEQTNKVSKEANNLATALKGQTKKQGNWGEMILEKILETSGLTKDREYYVQHTIKDEDGKSLRPDILINLPDNRTIIIDSKVSLNAYDRFSGTENVNEQKIHLNEHLKSMYNHIDDLSSKKYDNLESSLDFTMLFVPIEPAYMVSIQADQELWAYAYSKRILLISPTNLIACLKLISDLWKRELQSKNAMEIVKRGELLYEKFVTFVGTIEEVGKHINKSQSAYNTAIDQLKTGRGNLISQAKNLHNLGLKSSKVIPIGMLPVGDDVDE